MARENNDADDALLSYGSPRRSFSVNVSRNSSIKGADEEGRDASAAIAGDAQALLGFYRQRCEQFQQERQIMLDHVARIEVRGLLTAFGVRTAAVVCAYKAAGCTN